MVIAEPYGDAAVRCSVGALDDAHRLHRALVAAALPGVVNVVPAWRTVVVTCAGPRFVAGVLDAVGGLDLAALPPVVATEHVLPVTYDGPDLVEVAGLVGMSPDEVVRRHVAGRYVVAFLGFAPGFPYLTGLDPALAVPRRATPRTAVAAGTVGIADDVTGIYPAASPGGWQCIGRTDAVLFDVERDPPALLAPGDVVRIEPAG